MQEIQDITLALMKIWSQLLLPELDFAFRTIPFLPPWRRLFQADAIEVEPFAFALNRVVSVYNKHKLKSFRLRDRSRTQSYLHS